MPDELQAECPFCGDLVSILPKHLPFCDQAPSTVDTTYLPESERS